MPSGRKISVSDEIIEAIQDVINFAPPAIASRLEVIVDNYDRKTNYCARWARRQRYKNKGAA